MKLTLAALCLCTAFAASAQDTTTNSGNAAPARAAGNTPSSRDPRACLEFPTREQVIACAEKFRPRGTPKKS